MVEVFRTDVRDEQHAKLLAEAIHSSVEHYRATFDLDDCDKILRVLNPHGTVESSTVINILLGYGYFCELLEDEVLAHP